METVEDLLADTKALLENYEHPRDAERIYNRLWHCLRWQQADSDNRISLLIVEVYRVFREHAILHDRWMLYFAAKEQIKKGDFTAKACLAFLLHDDHEGIVSTAALDLLAYGEVSPTGLSDGILVIAAILENRLARCPGAVFGSVISFGDARFAEEAEGMFRFLSPADIQVAARMQTGLVSHFAIMFWLKVAFANVDQDDHAALSVVGSAASALVNARRASREPAVADIRRVFPAQSASERIKLLKDWTFDEYANFISAHLYELERRERAPKVFPHVLTEWGLAPKSDPSEHAQMDAQQDNFP